MPLTIDSARTIYLIVAISYLLSAAILGLMRWRGTEVPAWVIIGWLVTGVVGIALSTALAPGRGLVWAAILVVLVPWMIYALIGDFRLGHYFMVTIDALALLAIAIAAVASYRPAFSVA